ncbi:MAG: 2,3-bisphosphoglycerate-independent phosphoglycerate mutase [Candidatus Heimdallarchaeota archaeon]|nr:MAG: 2,3-bisphosphoglycerate-independent phosphoglycerate mutase [Candidatus Heimdallarchaeota archaeon]
MENRKFLLFLMDGVGDRPIHELNEKTPLEAAKTPTMDKLAQIGITGHLHTIGRGITPGSDTAHLALFGYNPYDVYTGRGPFEAAGTDLPVKPGDIAFRTNMATIKDEIIVDRRAGRISKGTVEIEEALKNITIEDVETIFKLGIDHRAALVLRGPGLASDVTGNDPKIENKKPKSIIGTSPEAEKTARILKQYIRQASEIMETLEINQKRIDDNKLPANYLLVRGAGKAPHLESFQTKYGITADCVAGGGLYKGVASICGMKINNNHKGTGGVPTDVPSKVKAAMKSLERSQFVFLHVKGTDNFGHDNKPIQKMEFIDEIDRAIEPILDLLPETLICITGDHSTPCVMKDHSSDPLPVLMVGEGVRPDQVTEFGERPTMRGGLGHMLGQEVISTMLGLAGRVHKFGA